MARYFAKIVCNETQNLIIKISHINALQKVTVGSVSKIDILIIINNNNNNSLYLYRIKQSIFEQ